MFSIISTVRNGKVKLLSYTGRSLQYFSIYCLHSFPFILTQFLGHFLAPTYMFSSFLFLVFSAFSSALFSSPFLYFLSFILPVLVLPFHSPPYLLVLARPILIFSFGLRSVPTEAGFVKRQYHL
jgi:hypothetical protein